MSDDEYIYDSPYEDVYDLLYDADPAPELADDLAERAVYSPVWQHTHTGELKDYFSDWDEYSDDYWDDDPKLLNDSSANGKPPKDTRINPPKPTKRGRKRKLSEARGDSIATQKSIDVLKATLRGTVWKRKSPELENNYRKGSEKPTALRLSDSIMRSAYNKSQGFGRGGLKRDESWANDLSLADMGLATEAVSLVRANSIEGEEDDEEDENEDDDFSPKSDLRTDDLMAEKDTVASYGPGVHGEYDTTETVDHGVQIETSTGPHSGKDNPDEEQISRKRRKVATTIRGRKEQAMPSIETPTSIVSEADKIAVLKSRKKARNLSEDTARDASSQEPLAQENQDNQILNGHQSRKRKLSPESSATASTASSRAKRAAADKTLPQSKLDSKGTQAGRTTRGRKA